jgi:hypothetical protein
MALEVEAAMHSKFSAQYPGKLDKSVHSTKGKVSKKEDAAHYLYITVQFLFADKESDSEDSDDDGDDEDVGED